MGIAHFPIERLRNSAAQAARMQFRHLDAMRLDVSSLDVRPISEALPQVPTVGVAAADAGLVSVELAPFSVEFLLVADDQARIHVAELFPLTTLAADLEGLFQRIGVLADFAREMEVSWEELSDLWQRKLESEVPFPRDVRLVADTLREISEWAVCLFLARENTPPPQGRTGPRLRKVILYDGLLRSILLRHTIISKALPAWWRDCAWRDLGVAIAGVGKSSQVWQKLAPALEMDPRVRSTASCAIFINPEFEKQLSGRIGDTGPRMGFGNLVLVKATANAMGYYLPVDLPPWVIDDRELCDQVLAQIVRTSASTFPRPGYPTPLGRAHEAARLNEFDAAVIKDQVVGELRRMLSPQDFELLLRNWSFQPRVWDKVGRIGRQ